MSKYKLMREDDKKGFWIEEVELLKLIRICKIRNKAMHNKLVSVWEHLEGKNYKENDGKII